MTLPNWRNASGTQSPPLMTSVDGTYQVGALIAVGWDLLVFKRSLTTGLVTQTVNLSSIPALVTYGITPIMSDALGGDSHWAAAIAIDDQNRVHIAGNSQSVAPHYIRSAPNDLTTWTTFTWPWPGFPSSGGVSVTGSNLSTYNMFNRLADGRLLWITSQRESAAESFGIDYLGFVLPLGASNWVPLVGQGEMTSNGGVGPPEQLYVNGLFVEQKPHPDRVWVWGVFRDVWTDPTTQRRPWIIYSDNVTDSTSWKRVDGSSQTMPFTPANSGYATDSGAIIPQVNGTYTFNSGQLVVDTSGNPHVVLKEGATSNSWHVHWTGSTWTENQCNTSSPTPSLFATRTGVRMYRNFGGRITVSSISAGGAFFNVGPPVPTGANGYNMPYADPVQLTKGVLHLLIPDGDTPNVETFGEHCPCYAAP